MKTQKTILVIEDDEDLLNLYRISLEKSGFHVLIAGNGLEGISVSLSKKPDLILLDMMMPISDGKDVLSMIRLHEGTKTIPIIIISNLNPDAIDIEGLDEQVIDHWIKSELSPKTLSKKLFNYFS